MYTIIQNINFHWENFSVTLKESMDKFSEYILKTSDAKTWNSLAALLLAGWDETMHAYESLYLHCGLSANVYAFKIKIYIWKWIFLIVENKNRFVYEKESWSVLVLRNGHLSSA